MSGMNHVMIGRGVQTMQYGYLDLALSMLAIPLPDDIPTEASPTEPSIRSCTDSKSLRAAPVFGIASR